MGTTPAKQFNPPTPFGSTPQTNNVSQVQPLAFNQGPGFAAASAFDQTQQQPQAPQMPSQPMFMQNPTMAMLKRGDTNPFFNFLNQ